MSSNSTRTTRQPIEYISHMLFIVEGTGMTLANGLIVVTLLCHKAMRKSQMPTMVALAIPDGLYGFGIVVGGARRLSLVVAHTDQIKVTAWHCMRQFPTIFYIAGSQMTSLAMLLISIDRYMAMGYSSWYLSLDEKRYARRIIFGVIGYGVFVGGVAVVSTYFSFGDNTHVAKWPQLCLGTWAVPGWYATGYTLLVAIGGYLSVVIYGMVLMAYRKYARATMNDEGSSALNKIKLKRERRLTKTMAIVTLVTLLLHSAPYTIIILTTLKVFVMEKWLIGVLNPFLWCMVCGNSLANIFIYLKRHRKMRAAMADVIRGRFNTSAVHPVAAVSSRVQTSEPNNVIGSLDGVTGGNESVE